MPITSWNIEDRPREKFEANGPNTLSKAELLAILVGSGSTKKTAVELMRDILSDHNDSIHELERLSVKELCKYDGVGPAKAITILAACAIANRYAREDIKERQQMNESDLIYRYYNTRIGNLPHEECHLMLLDNNLRMIGSHLLSKGGLTAASVDIREVAKAAVVSNATAVVLCHNHPSGAPNPSRQDDDLTHRIKEALALLNIRLIDHLVVCANSYYSYQEHQRL